MIGNAHLRLAFARKWVNGSHVSSREAPFFLTTWGPSRFPSPIPTHRLEASR